MKHLFLNRIIVPLFAVLLFALPGFGDDVVVINSSGAGQLALTPEAYVARRLKITGHIDARDFKTLKDATMSVTQELDLSEAKIDEYIGTKGCYSPIESDMFVGNAKNVRYPANELPIHAFTLVADNTLTKWHFGSSTLRKLVLPANISRIGPDALYKNDQLSELLTLNTLGGAVSLGIGIFNHDKSRLIGITPAYNRELVLPSSVTAIADSVLKGAVICGMDLRKVKKIDFSQQGEFSCAYVLANPSEDYAGQLKGIDVTDEIRWIELTGVESGKMLDAIKGKGVETKEVRALRLEGKINQDDAYALLSMEHLHFLDLSGAEFDGAQLSLRWLSQLCRLQLPSGNYALNIMNCPFLCGKLVVPEGVTGIGCSNTPMLSEVILPSTLREFKPNSFGNSLIERADLSACTKLSSISGLGSCLRMTTLLLPEELEELGGIVAPLSEVKLPSSLKRLTNCAMWNIGSLEIPASLEELGISRFWNLTKLDAPAGSSLQIVNCLDYCPRLEEVDFTKSPIKSFSGLKFDALPKDEVAKSRTVKVVSPGVNGGRSFIHSKFDKLSLPSTVTEIKGLTNCTKLVNLDLFNCSALRILEFEGRTSLGNLKLPADLESIMGLSDSEKLTTVYSAANVVAPSLQGLTGEEQWGKVKLIVPTGCVSFYANAEGWSKFGSIEEGGYSILTASSVDNVPMTGAGLYGPGQTVSVSAPASAGLGVQRYYFEKWEAEGQSGTATSFTFVPKSHTTALATYTEGRPALENADITFTVTSPTDRELTVFFRGQNSDIKIYNQSGLCATGSSGYSFSLPLAAGENRFGVVSGQPTYISIGGEEGTGFVLKNFNVKHPEILKELGLTYVGMTQLEVNEYPNLERLYCEGNSLKDIDVSGCPILQQLYCGRNLLTSIDVSGCPKLQTLDASSNMLGNLVLGNGNRLEELRISGNRLTSLDVRTCSRLLLVDCSDNIISTLAVPENNSLRSLYVNRNALGFSQISQALYPLIVKTNSSYGILNAEYVPAQKLIEGSTLDLTEELTAGDGTAVDITVTPWGNCVVDADGARYTFKKSGTYYLTMSCSSMPDLNIIGYLNVEQGTGIDNLLDNGISLRTEGRRISIGNLPSDSEVMIHDIAGKTLGKARDSQISFNVPTAGVYIVRVIGNQGKSFGIKVKVE